MTLRIGIIGSCVSRLAFRSDFIPENKAFFNVVQYQFHTSIISIMSRPIDYDRTLFKGNDDEYAKEHLMSELEKDGLNNLIASNPDILVIDFYPDVHFGISYTETSIITNKCWRYKKIEAFNKIKIKNSLAPTIDFEEYFNLWKDSLDKFMQFMNDFLPNTKIIITSARFSKLQNIQGEHKPINSEFDLDKRNFIWNKLDDYAIEKYNLDRIDLRHGYMATSNHTHGLDPLHFEIEYYADFICNLATIAFGKKIKDLDSLNKLNKAKELVCFKQNILYKENKKWNLLDCNNLNLWLNRNNFNISGDEIEINVSEEKKPLYNQLLSLPIEVNCSNISYIKYKLSFEVMIDDLDKLSRDQAIFLVRTYNNKFSLWHKDAISSEMLRANDLDIKTGQWNKVELFIVPRGRFIRLAPYLTQNGHIKWRNICLMRVQD